jgi:hypothetical protein
MGELLAVGTVNVLIVTCTTVTVAVALCEESRPSTATTWYVPDVLGAVYNPVFEMVPPDVPSSTVHSQYALPCPVHVAVNCCVPNPARVTDDGLIVTPDTLATMKLSEFETPPPGAGFVTTTGNVPAVARSPEVREIASWLALTNVGVCETPLNVTVDAVKKPLPLIPRTCGVAPTDNELGVRFVIAGIGLLEELPTTKMRELVVVPLPVVTVTGPEIASAGTLV